METFVVAYYRLGAGPYRGIVLAFPTAIPEGDTLADLADDARAIIDARHTAPFRVELVNLAAYDAPIDATAHKAALAALRQATGQDIGPDGA
jgi:hypothetical protein